MRVILVVIAALGIATLACGDWNEGGVTPTSTAKPLSTSTPAMSAPAMLRPTVALPIPEWIAANLFGVLEWGQQFIADTVSGEIWELEYSGERRPSYSGNRLAAWLPNGEALVSVTDGSRTTLYRGAPGEPLRQTSTLEFSNSSTVWRSSGWASNGELLAQASGLITDMKTGDIIAELDEPVRTVIGWSADGRYVAFGVGSASERAVLVWEPESGLTERISTWSAVWSSTGARLAYGPSFSSLPPNTGPFEVRVRDFNAGTDTVVNTRDTRARPVAWSADDRFLANSLYMDSSSTLIIDMTGERGEVLVPHAEPHAWLGTSHTLLATGDSCEYTAGVSDHVVTVEADGSGLRRYTDSPLYELYPRASPDGRLVAFDAPAGPEGPSTIRLLTLATGEITVLAAGPAITLFENSIDPALAWSPDGRYVVFGVTEGHDC